MTGIQEGMTAKQVADTLMNNFSEVSAEADRAKTMAAAEETRAKSAEEFLDMTVNGISVAFAELGVDESAKNDGYEIALRKKTNTAEKTKVKVPVYDIQNPSATPVGLVDEVFVADVSAAIGEAVATEETRAKSAEEFLDMTVNGISVAFAELGVDESAKNDGYEIALRKMTNTAEKTKVKIPVYDIMNPSATPVGLVDEVFVEDVRTAIGEAVSVEETRAKEEEQALRDNLDAEVQTRTEAVADMGKKLAKLESNIRGDKSLIFGKIDNQYKEGVYLDINGEFVNLSGGACRVTKRIGCKEGEVFAYRGRSEYSVAGWIMRNGEDIILVGQTEQNYIKSAVITIPSGVDSIQFSSYSKDSDVVLEVTKTHPLPLENQVSQLVFTENAVINKIVKTIFIDTSNYNGTLSLNGLYLTDFNVARNISGKYYWDFSIKNELGEYVVTNIWRTSSSDAHPDNRFEITSSGIYIYVEYIWENAEKGMTYENIPITKYVFDSINDPRVTRHKFTDDDIEGIQQEVYNTNYVLCVSSVNIINGYLNTSGTVDKSENLRGKYTSKIPCKEGDVYQYKGVGEYSTVSVLFYNNNDIVSYLQLNSKTTYTEVNIPSGVNYVVFASYAKTQNADEVIFDYKRIAPMLTYQDLLTKINQISAANNPLFGKKVGWNGDSVSEGGLLDGYGDIIAERNNMISQNISVSGGTLISNSYNSEGKLRHCICETVNNLDADCDYIIVEGGINDMWTGSPIGEITEGFNVELDSTTFCGAMETLIKNLYLRFPAKKMGFILIHQGATESWSVYKNTKYVTAIINICKKWGFPLLDLNTQVPPFAKFVKETELRNKLSAVYTTNNDGCHPTRDGYLKFYCNKIESWMKTL